MFTTDLFDCAVAARLTDHLSWLLESVTADLDRVLADLPLLTEQVWHRLVGGIA